MSSRHSVRNFKDKIVSREVIYDIVRDALYCPSACNRQPFKVYFSENPGTVKRIIKAGVEPFFAEKVHDALIVTCDRALLNPAERNDQEYINGGIFLMSLVLSIHAHGLGSVPVLAGQHEAGKNPQRVRDKRQRSYFCICRDRGA